MPEVNDWNTKIIDEFRANNGRVGGPFEGAALVLLHTTGAKSGKERINPLASLDLDGHLYVFASKAGAPTNPDWFHNIVANPAVTVEFGTETFPAKAVVLEGEERDRVFSAQKQAMPGFADYETKTERVIPVVELVRG